MDRIVIIGPESTGKSTLSQGLAGHYSEPWVPEYAREYLAMLDRPYAFEDLLAIARGQIQLEDSLAKKAGKLLFCDTDLHVIHVWSTHKFGRTHPWITQKIKERQYDLYLLTDIDIPWQDDPLREHPDPEMRSYFMRLYEKVLVSTGVPWVKISGNPGQRLRAGIAAIENSNRH
ncbi:nicotinamide-nucleotide adenylyltransferase, NadR type [Cyclobacterium lianum]|uniref:Nicotinamide-nucleotide adenylyltransferase, NadR type n=1 Tax=Cyclobacterium lianum TaxID=388280 RepID=A0A1M7HTV5_9BACT|nr:ATP-binding protein [Cyclobacterium lianum]SHM31991.1 nicotinamide-nucleotide adenylyltransferase, NadR type [Cyclobacterium lianum]